MDCFDSAFSVFFELRKQRKRLITAESLTGGLIAAEFTRVPGASEVFWGSFAAYTPEGMTPVWYSFAYNISYISIEAVITVALLLMPTVHKTIYRLKGRFTEATAHQYS